mgnify:CR=1 FL=1
MKKNIFDTLARGAPLFFRQGDGILNYVESWLDEPKDVREAAALDLDGASVMNGRMTIRLHTIVSPNFVQYVHSLESNYNGKIAGKCGELMVSLDTNGGYVTDGFEAIDVIREWNRTRDVKFSFAGAGAVYSMGVPLLQAGYRRYSYPNTQFLIHSVSGLALGTMSEIEDTLKSVQMLQKSICDTLRSRSGMSEEAVNALLSRDSFFTAEEALSMKLIDEILPTEAEEPEEPDDGEDGANDEENKAEKGKAAATNMTEAAERERVLRDLELKIMEAM